MAYLDPYNALWSQQGRLFDEIDMLKYQIADTERRLQRAQHTLDTPDVKRYDRRKAKWVANSQRRYLKDLDRDVQLLLRQLTLCQAHIARMHAEASWEATAYDNALDAYIEPLLQSQTNAGREVPSHQPRSLTPDSGFAEPAFYAHPFDLDLTQDTSTHVFSHQLQHPTPLDSKTTTVSDTILKPTADAFTPTPVTSRAVFKDISPLAAPFSPFPFAKANPPVSDVPLNVKPLFQPPRWSSMDSQDGVVVEATPISPTAAVGLESAGLGHKRRYSIAAIELIENRLKHKRDLSDAVKKAKVEELGELMF